MKRRLKEMEEEAAALRDMQAKVEKEMGVIQGVYIPVSPLLIFSSVFFVFSVTQNLKKLSIISPRSSQCCCSAAKQRRS